MIARSLTAALVSLLVPATAGAATVHVGRSRSSSAVSEYQAVKYDAARGERNRVLVTYTPQSDPTVIAVTVEDPGADIDAGSGCTSVDSHKASCDMATSSLENAEVHLRDRNDTLHTSRPTPYAIAGVDAFGGRGSDLLDGGAGPDYLNGGGGRRDRLLGGARADYLADGDRSGARGAAGPGRDVLDGGPFLDTVSYRQRKRRVTVDLRSGVGGERGERDAVRHVERLVGGPRGDRLVGNGVGNRLDGLGGPDVLIARGGPDWLAGGTGRDHLFGGGDGDSLLPGGGIDHVSCSRGADTVYQPVAGELLSRHCENASFRVGATGDPGAVTLTPNPVAVSSDSAEFRIPCPVYDEDDGEFRPCGGTIEIRTRSGRLLATGDIPTRGDSSEVSAVARLTPLGQELSARDGGVIADVSLSGDTLPEIAWTIRLKR